MMLSSFSAEPPTTPSKSFIIAARWGDAVVCLSLANLFYFRMWGLDFAARTAAGYGLRAESRPASFVGLMLDVFLLGGLFFLLVRGARHLERRPPDGLRFILRAAVGLAVFAVVSVFILKAYVWVENTTLARSWGLDFRAPIIAEIVALVVPILYWAGSKWLLRSAFLLLTIFSPLVALTFGQGIFRSLTFDPIYLSDKPPAVRLSPPASAPHVVWIIFDEWDEDLTFLHRPAGLELPEIDRLRKIAFYADRVGSPGPNTDWSMPALTVGRKLSAVAAVGHDDLALTLAGGETVHWNSYPNVFSEARKLGLDTGVIAWAIPYCRVLNRSLTGCYWLTSFSHYDNENVPEAMWRQFRGLPETRYRSPFGQALATRGHAWMFHQLFERSKETVSRQDYNLTLLHLPIPHPPFFYNGLTGKDDYGATPIRSLFQSGGAGYVDALALVDRSIGELRKTMEAAGTWDTTTILFSADHPYRERRLLDGKPMYPAVPFLVKLAGQNQALNCPARFSALLTHDLLLAVLKKEISTAEDLNAWILAHRDAFPTD
jgi:hypothetical protein